jgi:hypothetical protein
MIDGLPLSFFLPLAIHSLAGLVTGVTGMIAFCLPKRQGRHSQWGTRYLWAYTVVFLTALLLSIQRFQADAYLFVLATLGYGAALGGYSARRFRQKPVLLHLLGRRWVVAHIIGMIGSYVVLWTAFYVDNAHLIPLLNRLPVLVFWILPSLIGCFFMIVSISRFAPTFMLPETEVELGKKRGI